MGKLSFNTFDIDVLNQASLVAMQNAYSPYSQFYVGAALLSKSGRVYTACNVENASYSATSCAERNAFFKALSEGEREFVAISIAGGKDGIASNFCPPCGLCRQVMAEFCVPDEFLIILTDATGEYEIYTLAELLPVGFGKSLLD